MRNNDFDAGSAYRLMLRIRLVEEALTAAWADGLLPGEYHSGIGEEGINAGVLMHLGPDDAVALDHRNTAPMIGRGTDPESLMLEVLGSERGMNAGMAGHMHIIDPDVRAAADGMVGASGPLAVGQAFAGRLRRPGSVAVAFHGEAAMNQGMLMESYNMAAAWNLPVIFVCKDNKWSITTRSEEVTGAPPVRRARGFGLAVETAKGHDVKSVYAAAGRLVNRARAGNGPGFLYVTCHRPGGHFEGDLIVRVLKDPAGQAAAMLPELRQALRANTSPGLRGRAAGAVALGARVGRASRDWALAVRKDPVRRGRAALDPDVARRIEQTEGAAIAAAALTARAAVTGRPTFGITSKELVR